MDNRDYRPRRTAWAAFHSKAARNLFAGPAGTGKTRCWLEKTLALCDKYPASRHLWLRETRTSQTDTSLQIFEERVLPEGSPILDGANRAHRRSYLFPNGSEIVIGGMDKISRVLSSQYDTITIFQAEECEEDDVLTLLTRLRNARMPYQQLNMDCNPSFPQHWLKQWIDNGDVVEFQGTHEDNPTLYDDDKKEWTPDGVRYLGILDSLKGYLKDRLRYGRWVAAEGARWGWLDEKVHRFDKTDQWSHGLPSGWRVIIGTDHGTAAPYCALWIAIDHDGNAWVFKEDYEAGLTASQQAARIVQRTGGNERIWAVYADPSNWSEPKDYTGVRQPSVSEQYEQAFRADAGQRFGPLLRGYNKSRKIAMATIDKYLERDNGYPNLYIDKSCTNLWQELAGAVWWLPKSGLPKEDIDPSCADHAITSLYYALHTYSEAPQEAEQSIESMAARRAAEEIEAFEHRHGYRPSRVRV